MNKNIFKKILIALLTVVFSIFGCACREEDYSVKFSEEKIVMYVGESKALEVETLADMVEAEWSSDNPAVATVKYGIVTAVSKGVATIKLEVADKTVYAEITVLERETQAPPEEMNTIRILLDKIQAKLYVGSSIQLKATTYYNNVAIDGEVSWKSSNEQVCVVEKGKIQAVAEGVADISAKFEKDGMIAEARCTVNVVSSSELILPNKIVIGKGETYQLNPQSTEESIFSYESSDTNVVRVSSGGLIEHISNGEAVITVQNQVFSRATVEVCAVEKVMEISNANEFLQINNSMDGTYYLLTSDVDLTDVSMTMYQDKSSGGTEEQVAKVNKYNGTSKGGVYAYIDEFGDVLDGNGYKITLNNATTKDTQFNVMGLFNYLTESAVLKNLYVDTTVTTYAKLLAGAQNKPCTATFAYVNKGCISDCIILSDLYLKNSQAEPYKNNWSALILEQYGKIKDCIIEYNVIDVDNDNSPTQSRSIFVGGAQTTSYENVLTVSSAQEIFASNYLGGATTTNAICSGYIYRDFSSLITGASGLFFATGVSGVASDSVGYLNFDNQVWSFNRFDKELYFFNYRIYSENDFSLDGDVLAEDIFTEK